MATLNAPPSCGPIAYAPALREACEGLGTREKFEVILDIAPFQDTCNKHQLNVELENAVSGWTNEPYDCKAILANCALKNGDHKTIVELASVHNSDQLLRLKMAYQARFSRSLEEDVASHTTGDIRTALRSHLARHHPAVADHTCDVCGKTFDTGPKLGGHKTKHRNERSPRN